MSTDRPTDRAAPLESAEFNPGAGVARIERNAAGQLVRTLVNDVQEPRAAGFSIMWNGRNDAGEPVASGVYLYKLTAGNEYQAVKKLVLLK